MAKISIVVPVYNVEPYLRKCIDSIVHQIFRDIEIIIIDDGSTDGSGEICDEYASKDERIRVLHKNNKGLSCARNDGIDMSTAPYIMFVDSDDWVEPEFCELPLIVAKGTDADLVLFSYNEEKKGILTEVKIKMKDGELCESNAMYYNVYYSAYPWSCLYHRKLFENIRYPEEKIFEDVGTSHKLIHAANKIWLINNHLYNYRIQRPGSISANFNNSRHPDKREMLVNKIDDLLRWGYEEYTRKDAFSLLIWYGCQASDQKKYVDIIRRMKGNSISGLTWKKKAMLMLFRVSTFLFDEVCIITGRRVIIE